MVAAIGLPPEDGEDLARVRDCGVSGKRLCAAGARAGAAEKLNRAMTAGPVHMAAMLPRRVRRASARSAR